ncbi:MAG: class I SAM-dependent methyltransferase [Planctomycetota bacterium]|nr:class I SAM-dependent methyltransferase [Planctomycetota bacterium]
MTAPPAQPPVADARVPDPRVARALRGEAIYGDDFSPEEIGAWFEDEREGYANLLYEDVQEYTYVYHAMNRVHGFSRLPSDRRFNHALGFGAAYGLELLPIVDRAAQLTIVEPSEKFVKTEIGGKPARWVKPDPSGRLPFPDGTFDLVTCFGVLHHIPNVSSVIAEIARATATGGFFLVREPITSMGDWRRVRPALTKRERGLPLRPFTQALEKNGFVVRSASHIAFRPWLRACQMLKVPVYERTWSTRVDAMLSALTAWNVAYHTESALKKISPSAVYIVAERVRTA